MFKFRGISESTKEKVYGYYAKFEGKDVIVTPSSDVIPVLPDSVGVLVDVDRNGDEIYTGDTVNMKLFVPKGDGIKTVDGNFKVVFNPSNYGFALENPELEDGFIMLSSLLYGLSEKAVLVKSGKESAYSALFFFRDEYQDDEKAIYAVLNWLAKLMGHQWIENMSKNIVTGISGVIQINYLTLEEMKKIESNMPGPLSKYLKRYGFSTKPKISYLDLTDIIQGVNKNAKKDESDAYVIEEVNGYKHIFSLNDSTSLCGKEKLATKKMYKPWEKIEGYKLREYAAELANDGVNICPDCVAELYYNGEE